VGMKRSNAFALEGMFGAVVFLIEYNRINVLAIRRGISV
jgi:hypothetical protein